MKLKDLGEFPFIEKVAHKARGGSSYVIAGIGDDAAVFKTDENKLQLFTTDALVENVHFIWNEHSAYQIGSKAIAVNVSDIAAMGGLPKTAVITIGAHPETEVKYLDLLYEGMADAAAKYKLKIVGGDTVRSEKGLFISVAMTGEVEKEYLCLRSGGRPGDILCVTGPLGDARLGLEILKGNLTPKGGDLKKYLTSKHLTPEARLNEARFLASTGVVTAMIDISDGLAGDVLRLCERSGTGAVLDADSIPVSGAAEKVGSDHLDSALYGGEDYELLCALKPDAAESIIQKFYDTFGKPLYNVGVLTNVKKISLSKNGSTTTLKSGFDHFNLTQQ